jgi:hypothetical protein
MTTTTTYPSLKELDDGHQELSNVELAGLWLDCLGVGGQPRNLLLPIVADEVRRRRRADVRGQEARVLRNEHRRGGTPVDQDEMKKLLNATMQLNFGVSVRVGDATEADWQKRKEFLESQRFALQRSIDRCDVAIEILQQHQARTLAEVPADDIPDDFEI